MGTGSRHSENNLESQTIGRFERVPPVRYNLARIVDKNIEQLQSNSNGHWIWNNQNNLESQTSLSII